MTLSSPPRPPIDREARFLRRLLSVLALLTLAATIDKALGLMAPTPTVEAPTRLSLPGYEVVPLPSAPPRQGRELSHGTQRRFRLRPRSGASELTLTLLPVRSRTGTDLSEETFGGKGLSLDTVASVVPTFQSKEPRIVTLPIAPLAGPAGSASSTDQVRLARGSNDPAGATTRLQTCLTDSGQAAVKATTLASHNSSRQRSGTSRLMERLPRLAGLTQTRHECLAIQIETVPGAEHGAKEPQVRLERAWREVRQALRDR